MSQTLPHRFKDPRLSNVPWVEKAGDYGPYESVNVENMPDGQWLLDLFDKADSKGYIYDQEGVYRYKRNKNWINRFKKSKADRAAESMALGIPVSVQQAAKDGILVGQEQQSTVKASVSTSAFQEREDKKSAQIQKLHDERMQAEDRQTEAINRLAAAIEVQNVEQTKRYEAYLERIDKSTESNNKQTEQLGNLTRQLEDLCFLLGEQNKAKGGS